MQAVRAVADSLVAMMLAFRTVGTHTRISPHQAIFLYFSGILSIYLSFFLYLNPIPLFNTLSTPLDAGDVHMIHLESP